jgi:hypothetical protein
MPSYINLLHDKDLVHSIIDEYNAILQNTVRESAMPTNPLTSFFSATLYLPELVGDFSRRVSRRAHPFNK